jgi:hypothetical protein
LAREKGRKSAIAAIDGVPVLPDVSVELGRVDINLDRSQLRRGRLSSERGGLTADRQHED